MDNEMIERVAQAICGDNNPTNILSIHRDRAKAAIKAMREPTEKMIEAGCEGNPTQWNENTDLGFAADVANDVYQTMIDAILND